MTPPTDLPDGANQCAIFVEVVPREGAFCGKIGCASVLRAGTPCERGIEFQTMAFPSDVETWRKEVRLTCRVSRPRELDTSSPGSWR